MTILIISPSDNHGIFLIAKSYGRDHSNSPQNTFLKVLKQQMKNYRVLILQIDNR